jgi:hypothetical protein
MNAELFALGDVARILATKPHRILYALSVGSASEPRLRVAGKRLWTMAEIASLAEVLKLQMAVQDERERGIDG